MGETKWPIKLSARTGCLTEAVIRNPNSNGQITRPNNQSCAKTRRQQDRGAKAQTKSRPQAPRTRGTGRFMFPAVNDVSRSEISHALAFERGN